MFLKFSQNNAASAPGMAYLARHNASYICVIPGGGMARRRDDAKEAALREARCLNPRPEAVADQAFTAGPEFFDARDLVQVKYEMVRRVRAEGQPVTAAAAAFGFSRPSLRSADLAAAIAGRFGITVHPRSVERALARAAAPKSAADHGEQR
jgi:hypothetical protein